MEKGGFPNLFSFCFSNQLFESKISINCTNDLPIRRITGAMLAETLFLAGITDAVNEQEINN